MHPRDPRQCYHRAMQKPTARGRRNSDRRGLDPRSKRGGSRFPLEAPGALYGTGPNITNLRANNGDPELDMYQARWQNSPQRH